MKVAIIGAGIAGLACAERLKANGFQPVLFDKGKRPGGRLSTLQLDDKAWDFGCQYVKPDSGAFARQVADWSKAGLLAPWEEGPEGAMVGTPGMNALVAAQCAKHDVRFNALVQRIESDGLSWFLSGPDLCEGPFAALAIAIPSEQAAPLLSLHDLLMAREAASARSQPCWTVMAAFDAPLAGVPAYLQDRGAIAWATRNNSKPGRGETDCWVIQAGAEWSQQHLEMDREEVAQELFRLFQAECGVALTQPTFLKAHRWRFALAFGQHGATMWNPQLRLGACGDWCMAPQVEGAWLSGVELADKISASLRDTAQLREYSSAK